MKKLMTAGILSLSLALAGCNSTGIGTKQGIGALAGAAAGGILGNQVSSGSGKTVATVIGVLAGGLIGSQIGAALDKNDRQAAVNAEYRALEYGQSGVKTEWRNPDTKNHGQVVPQTAYTVNGRQCRDYTHTIYIAGKAEVARGTACRLPDGTWQPTS